MIKNKTTLWRNFSRAIRQKQANHQGQVSCVSCGRVFNWQDTDCGHFFENTERKQDWGGNELWYNEKNFGTQCPRCNRFASAEGKQEWTARFIAIHGQKVYDNLKSLREIPKKWTPEEVNDIINKIKKG